MKEKWDHSDCPKAVHMVTHRTTTVLMKPYHTVQMKGNELG
jgi:hypothetical protein